MKFALAFLAQDEEAFLRLHLPVFLDSSVFDGAICVDGGSNDGTVAYLKSMGVTVFKRAFANNFGAQGNYLIDCCEAEGYDAILRIDPDELMFPADLAFVRQFLEQDGADLVAFSRFHFIGDRRHYNPEWLLDSQWRAWKLNKGIRYPAHLHVHEVPCGDNVRMMHLEPIFLYHYGYTLPPAERAYKIGLYEAIEKGKPLPNKAEYADQPPLIIPNVPFTGAQPLSSDVIGSRAPFLSEPADLKLSVDPTGDRTLEYGWITLNTPSPFGNGQALDFGSGGVGILSEHAQRGGWQVTALDFEATRAPAGVQMITGDVLSLDLPQYSLILNCSSIEHVGLEGRYGVTDADEDGDLSAMRKLYDALTPGGLMLLTTPVGVDHVHQPMHRIYGVKRLPKLLDGFEVLSEHFWTKLPQGTWKVASKDEALATYSIAVSRSQWQGCIFSLGVFALRKPC